MVKFDRSLLTGKLGHLQPNFAQPPFCENPSKRACHVVQMFEINDALAESEKKYSLRKFQKRGAFIEPFPIDKISIQSLKVHSAIGYSFQIFFLRKPARYMKSGKSAGSFIRKRTSQALLADARVQRGGGGGNRVATGHICSPPDVGIISQSVGWAGFSSHE